MKEQLENEKRNTSEVKRTKTQQVCTLTFKLANAVRQRERTEDELAKLQKEIKELKEIIQKQEKQLNEKQDLEGKTQNEGILTSLQQNGNEEATRLTETPKLERPADDGDSVVSSLRFAQCRAAENDLEQLHPEPVVDDSFQDNFSTEQQYQEAQISPPDAGYSNEPRAFFTDYDETQECKETIARELNKIQREMHEIKASISCVQQMNHYLAENLKHFAKRQKRMLKGSNSIATHEALRDGKNTGEDNHLFLPSPPEVESPRRECVVGDGPEKDNINLSEHLSEEKHFAQKAEHDGLKNIPEEEAGTKSFEATEKFSDVENVTPLNEMLKKQECENTRIVLKENSDDGRFETVGFATTNNDSSFLNVSEIVENFKHQLTQALREIENLRRENKEIKTEIREILIPKTDEPPLSTKHSLEETKQHPLNCSHGDYRWLRTSTNRDICRWQVAHVDPSRRNSLPLRVIGARLEEITRLVENLAMSTLADEEILLQESECTEDFVNHEGGGRQYDFGSERYITPAGCFERSAVARNLVYKKVDEERFCPSTRPQQLLKIETTQTEDKFKPAEHHQEVTDCGRINRPWKTCLSDPRDRVQRYIVRSSEHIAKMRDLKPEELPFYTEKA